MKSRQAYSYTRTQGNRYGCKRERPSLFTLFTCLLCLPVYLLLIACQPDPSLTPSFPHSPTPPPVSSPTPLPITPIPTRPPYVPGELVDYTAQTGDMLPALAARFNTTVSEILEANEIIPQGATTMPPGMPMKIPIYYLPLWGSAFKILPDSQFVNGPAQVDFDTEAFVAKHPGWLKSFTWFVAGANRSGAEIVDYVAQNFSISPRLLLALLEYQTGALSQTTPSVRPEAYPLGNEDRAYQGLYLQMVWAANKLNNGYYGWRTGDLVEFDLLDGRLERPDPWQNTATVALQYYFSVHHTSEQYVESISPTGFAQTYQSLFEDPWETDEPHIPGSLEQPPFSLPFELKRTWAYTGGPHTGWGNGAPLAALDFAPPSITSGCFNSDEWATAIAPGVVARSESGIVVLDLDKDGDERTGWILFYLHIGTEGRASEAAVLDVGDPIGHPSCEGGSSTGSNIHIARRYNGEWIPAGGTLAFNLDGWIAHNGDKPYNGTLERFSRTVIACECSNQVSQIQRDEVNAEN